MILNVKFLEYGHKYAHTTTVVTYKQLYEFHCDLAVSAK